jgi:hypothetical protein
MKTHGFRWKWVVSFTPLPSHPRGPLNRRLGGFQNRCGLLGEEKNLPLPGLEIQHLGHTTLSQLLYQLCYSQLEYFLIQGDSKLLSRFPWPIIFKLETKKKKKLLTEYESVTQKVDSISNKTFGVAISYSVGSFILLFLVWKLQATETPTIN